jgi:hypothetical protein
MFDGPVQLRITGASDLELPATERFWINEVEYQFDRGECRLTLTRTG